MSDFDVLIEDGLVEKNYWRDLWRYRELFYFLSMRDILVRYKQTVIGVAWSIIRPLVTLIVFSTVFGRLAGLPSNGVPYPLLVAAGTLPWQFFSTALLECSNSIVGNAGVVSKVYFPRVIIPGSAIIVSFVDFGISLSILLALIVLVWNYAGSPKFLLMPFFVLLATAAALGIGLFFAALNVRYRDFRYLVPFLVQIGLYVSPVGFSSSIIPAKYRLLYSLNPMVAVIDGFRWAVTGQKADIYWPGFLLSLVLTFVALLGGFYYFRRTEREFADVI